MSILIEVAQENIGLITVMVVGLLSLKESKRKLSWNNITIPPQRKI